MSFKWLRFSSLFLPNTVVIRSESDFPAPIGGTIFLEGKKYILSGAVTHANELEPPANMVCTITGENSAGSSLTYTGVGTQFKNTSFGAGLLVMIEGFFSAPNGQMYDLTGNAAGFMAAFNCVFSDIDTFGTLSGIGFSVVQSNVNDVGQGLIADSNAAATMGRLNWANGKNQPGAIMFTVQGTHGNVQMSSNFFTTAGSDETVFDIKAASTQVAGIVVGNGINLSAGGAKFAGGSKDQTDINWMYAANTGIDASKAVGGVLVNSNAAITATTASFGDMNLGTAVVGSNIERWQLNSATTGELEYIGLEERGLTITASITAVKSGGGAAINCDFRAFIDKGAGFVDLADILDAPLEIKTTLDSKTLIVPVIVQTGDKVKIQVRNNTNTDPIVICNYSNVID